MNLPAYSLAFILALGSAAWAQHPAPTGPYPHDPDPSLTPGAIATSDIGEICARVNGLTYTKRHRVWTGQLDTLRKYGIDPQRHAEFEDDDLVPVCLGADNSDPHNHWPEAWPQALVKDKLDAAACRLVCEHKISVPEAQGWFLHGWRDGYRAVFHEEPGE